VAEQTSMLDEALAGNFRTQRRKAAGQGQGSNDPFTKNGYDRSEVVSALQKAIRRNQEPQALYWATELMESNQGYQMWRRLLVIAAEDVGLADPDMVMRIMAMKQAHDMGREWNIPFLAVMILCRSPKNREADDAAWYYECRRKEGWKIPVPPEAVDGHTQRGRRNLYARARDRDEEWTETWNWEFYFDAALLDNYVEIETKGEPERYKKLLCDYLRIPYDTYDIASCSQIRMLSGPESKSMARAERVIPDAVKYEPYADPETGEVRRDTYWVTSFTDPETRYVVDLYNEECSCPAFVNGGGTLCKHLVMLRRKERVER
jgi:MgsA-like AAA+ ATPase family protein